jgi:serine phosphatase RsbU (regulator of sigma subunit)
MYKIPLLPQRSILARLQFSHLMTSLLPLLTLGFLLLYNSTASERRVVEQTQTSVAQSIALDISRTIQQYDTDLLILGLNVPLDDQNAAQNEAKEFLSDHESEITDLAVLDLNGQEVTRITGEQVFPLDQLRNRSGEPFFETAARGRIDHSMTVHEADDKRVMQIAVPAKDSINTPRGVVVAMYMIDDIEARLSEVPKDVARSAFVIDDQGEVQFGKAEPTLEGVNDLTTWAQRATTVDTLTEKGGSQSTAVRIPIEGSTWSLVIEQPTEVAFAGLRRNTLLLALVLIGTALLVVLWGIVVGREMTRPILQLRDGVKLLGSGQLGDTIEVAREDELGDLAHEFNSMSERLAESQRAIEQRNQRLSEGLDLARLIQQDLLPQAPPPNSAIMAYAVCEPATEIGGDFYTYVALPGGRVRLVIGDASGKGVAAALVMALTSSLVEVHARQAESPAELLTRLNAELYPRLNPSHMSVSLLVAEFDPHNQQLCAANAGMIAPLIARHDGCSYVSCFGPPLGVVESVTYAEATYRLAPDQAVVFVSDGIVEARNAANDMWGFHNLETTVCVATDDRAQGIVAHVLSAVREHVRDTPAADDMTIIATMLRPSVEEDSLYALVPLADTYVPTMQPTSD